MKLFVSRTCSLKRPLCCKQWHLTSTKWVFWIKTSDKGGKSYPLRNRRCPHLFYDIDLLFGIHIKCYSHLNSSPLVPCHIYASMNLVITSSGNGVLPVRRHAITWTNVGLLSIGLMGTNFSEVLSSSLKKMHLKLSSAKMAAILSRGRGVDIYVVTH